MFDFESAKKIFNKPFLSLIYEAYTVHIRNHDQNIIQASTLLSIQTGGCCEDCAYCAQSIKNKTKMPKQRITNAEEILSAAQRAKAIGSSRFCMGASGRTPDKGLFEMVCQVIRDIKALGLETCLTMGTLSEEQAIALKNSGLDFYNHNIDTSPEYYSRIITTRTIDERIRTINLVQKHGIKVCTGGILGIGETNDDRIKMIMLLANLHEQPASVSINKLVKIPGTPLENAPDIDPFDFVRIIALARILMPKSVIRISAGRETMSDELQTLCFLAGAGSIFIGEKLLTTPNSEADKDIKLLSKLGLKLAIND